MWIYIDEDGAEFTPIRDIRKFWSAEIVYVVNENNIFLMKRRMG